MEVSASLYLSLPHLERFCEAYSCSHLIATIPSAFPTTTRSSTINLKKVESSVLKYEKGMLIVFVSSRFNCTVCLLVPLFVCLPVTVAFHPSRIFTLADNLAIVLLFSVPR
jgi:hypothetical protein